MALAELALLGEGPEAALVVPADELLDDAVLRRFADRGELGGGPFVEADQVGASAAQDAVGDKKLSEPLD